MAETSTMAYETYYTELPYDGQLSEANKNLEMAQRPIPYTWGMLQFTSAARDFYGLKPHEPTPAASTADRVYIPSCDITANVLTPNELRGMTTKLGREKAERPGVYSMAESYSGGITLNLAIDGTLEVQERVFGFEPGMPAVLLPDVLKHTRDDPERLRRLAVCKAMGDVASVEVLRHLQADTQSQADFEDRVGRIGEATLLSGALAMNVALHQVDSGHMVALVGAGVLLDLLRRRITRLRGHDFAQEDAKAVVDTKQLRTQVNDDMRANFDRPGTWRRPDDTLESPSMPSRH